MTSSKPSASSSTKSSKQSSKSALGAPSQLSQSSRKGKRAWRKHIDIQEVEQGLESLRAEERVIGTLLQKQADDQLYVVDSQGDERVRRSLPRYSASQLTSAKILAQRSAVPAVVSRAMPNAPMSGTTKRVSRADKERLLRIAKRPLRGPFNTIVDPPKSRAGISHAVQHSGTHDLWAAPVVEESVPDGLERVRKQAIKKPELKHPRDLIDVPAVSAPHPGASYNPPVQAHSELIMEAYNVELRRREEAIRLLEAKKRLQQAHTFTGNDATVGVPDGMMIDQIRDDEETTVDELVVVPKKLPARKTKQQRARIAKQKAEKHALAEKSVRKRLLNSISQVKGIRSDLSKLEEARRQTRLARQLAARLKLQKGLAGQRLGKHRVPANNIDVQIGEDLSENLRNLKPEGNLFRDRFVSLQQRALIEPRAQVLPTKPKAKPIEYEKHAWKRFE